MAREVWITGYGLLSPQGETSDAWWPRLQDPALFREAIDSTSFAPFHVFPIRSYDLARQVPRPGDQRAMGPLMHYGVYAAGAALEAAGVKGDEALLLETHLVVASGGGERDWTLDHQIIEALDTTADRAAMLNQKLSDDLRPTLFLAQLPNLFAGNISIVHGVAGSSRTFMGEEAAGVDAVRVGFEKIAAGQGDLFLVGATFNASRPDMISALHAGKVLMSGVPATTNLWDRPEAGINLGSAGAFLVLEAREHAETRGARPVARMTELLNDRSDRRPGAATAKARAQWDRIAPRLRRGRYGVLSGACGKRTVTRDERDFLSATVSADGAAVRGTAAAFGHSVEASFPANLILALSCLERRLMFPPLNPDEPLETQVADGPVDQVVVTAWGETRGEGMALLEAIDGN